MWYNTILRDERRLVEPETALSVRFYKFFYYIRKFS